LYDLNASITDFNNNVRILLVNNQAGGEFHFNIGKQISDETKKKISMANKCIVHTEEWNKKIGTALVGKVKSTESNEKNRIAHLGKKYSDETNAKKGSKAGKNPSAVKCSIKGINFDTLDESVEYAIKKFGLTQKQAFMKFSDPYELDFIKHKDIIAANSQKVSIDGIVFDSKTKAYFKQLGTEIVATGKEALTGNPNAKKSSYIKWLNSASDMDDIKEIKSTVKYEIGRARSLAFAFKGSIDKKKSI
jgi:hypothetical protein